MLAPSQMRIPRAARRRSDGVVITTTAAATPADASAAFATVRALARVTNQLRRGVEPEPPLELEPPPRTFSVLPG
jgi:hypothetical protein